MWLIAWREGRALLATPLLWLTAAVSQFLLAWYFLVLLDRYQLHYLPKLTSANSALGVTDLVVVPFMGGMPLLVLLLMVCAVLGMGLIAEERRRGSLPLLLSAPVRSLTIVLGKYAAGTAAAMALVTLWWLMPASLAVFTGVDPLRLLLGLGGLYLLSALFMAVTLLASTVAHNAATAAAGAFAAGVFLLMFSRTSGRPGGVLDALSATGHLQPLLQGRLSSADVAYFVLASAVLVALAALRMQRLRSGP